MRFRARTRQAAKRIAIAITCTALGVTAGLGLAELGASALHRGAYPHLNLFVPDARYGVRLQPGARTRVRSRLGTVTEIATDERGYRAAWPATASDAGARADVRPVLLLLGDSQVLGYGLPYEDSIPARLQARHPELKVVAAAVPSWGPPEYLRALADEGAQLRPLKVVFVANLANDWLELSVANPRRTTARDGWALQATADALAQPAGGSTGGSGLGGWLRQRSHLWLAARMIAGYAARDAGWPTATAPRAMLDALSSLRRAPSGRRSRMTAPLAAAQAECRRLGCALYALGLPLDAQVDPREWAKYHAPAPGGGAGEPASFGALGALLTDFVADAADLEVPALDATDALRRAEPGAFQPDDYHLSQRGADVVAGVVDELLRAPPVIAHASARTRMRSHP